MIHINLLSCTLTWQTRQIRRDLEGHKVLGAFLAEAVYFGGYVVEFKSRGYHEETEAGFLRFVETGSDYVSVRRREGSEDTRVRQEEMT